MAIANPAYGLVFDPKALDSIHQRALADQGPREKAIQAALEQTPEYRTFRAALQGRNANIIQLQQLKAAVGKRAEALGMSEDFWLSPSGDIVEQGWIDKHPALMAAMGAGGAAAMFAIPVIAGAGATTAASSEGAAAATTAGTGVGVGETAATTGLASGAGLPGAVAAPVATGSTLATIGKYAKLASDVGQGIGGATEAAANRQFREDDARARAAQVNVNGERNYDDALMARARLGLDTNVANLTGARDYESGIEGRARIGIDANNSNISGESAYQSALQAIARTEQEQRGSALKDVYRASVAENPSHSLYNPNPTPGMSEEYRNTLASLSHQGTDRLANPAQYDTRNMRAPVAYQPIAPNMPGQLPYTPIAAPTVAAPKPYVPFDPNVSPSTMQQIGNWVGPTLSILGAVGRYYGR